MPGVITRFYVFANAPFGMTLFALQGFSLFPRLAAASRRRRQSHRQRDGKRGEIHRDEARDDPATSVPDASSTPVRGSTAYIFLITTVASVQ